MASFMTTQEWFVLTAEGDLIGLGKHDSFEEADEQASLIGQVFGWIVSPKMAEQWLKTIIKEQT